MRKKLSDMNIGESGFVRKTGDLKEFKNRLIELGILNTPIKVIKKSPFNDPIAINLGNTTIVIRNEDAKKNRSRIAISSMGTIYGVELNSAKQKNSAKILQQKIRSSFPNSKAAFAYLVFILLYIPCVSTMAAIKAEFGWKLMFLEITLLPIIAYIISFIIYQILLRI